jgi:hypothetical protein
MPSNKIFAKMASTCLELYKKNIDVTYLSAKNEEPLTDHINKSHAVTEEKYWKAVISFTDISYISFV